GRALLGCARPPPPGAAPHIPGGAMLFPVVSGARRAPSPRATTGVGSAWRLFAWTPTPGGIATSAPLVERQSYATPDLAFDVVMKGGITSGVVYPLAVCELATRYRFESVGGASAGAIAAVGAAAAEHGRHTSKGGFPVLAALPDEVATVLPDLFQPQRSTSA